MRYVYIILCFMSLIFPPPTTAGPLWEWEHPTPQGGTLNDIDIYGTATAMAVGVNATVIRTTDAGDSWTVATYLAGEEAQLNGICLINTTQAITVGDGGIILRTSDGGETWAVQVSGTSNDLFGVDFGNELHGTAVGDSGTVLRTNDGGVTWTAQSIDTMISVTGVACAGADTVYLTGYGGAILRSIDGGANWIEQDSGLSNGLLRDIYFVDGETGWVVGASACCWSFIAGTTDGGVTWTEQSGLIEGGTLYSAYFTDANHGIAVGRWNWHNPYDSDFIMGTVNGESWEWIPGGNKRPFYGVAMFDSSDALAVGHAGIIGKTTEGYGGNWVEVGGTSKTSYPMKMQAIDAYGKQHEAAVANNYGSILNDYPYSILYYSTDIGSTWNEYSIYDIALTDLAFASPETLYAVGQGAPGSNLGPEILRITNDGAVWTTVYATFCPGGCNYGFFAVDFGGPNNGIAVGPLGLIVKIENGTATEIVTSYTNSFSSVSMPTATTAYVAGSGGLLLKSVDGGDNWAELSFGPAASVTGISFVDELTGTAVGGQGLILRTTNGGTDWIEQESGIAGTLFSVSFLNDLVGVAASKDTLLKTKDGGATWVPEAKLLTSVADVALIDQLNVVAVGGLTDIVARRDVPVGVLLRNFTARLSPRGVELEWTVTGVGAVIGYRLYRSENGAPPVSITEALLPVESSAYTDPNVRSSAEYEYTLASVASDGSESYSSPVSITLPGAHTALLQNYPNPFSPETTIRFVLPERAHVSLRVYDAAGRLVATLVHGIRRAGGQDIVWSGVNEYGERVPSGIYFYQLKTGGRTLSRKMVLLTSER